MTLRHRLLVEGVVQGVGFRPFVFNLAESLDLRGWVCNTSDGVLIEIEGSLDHLTELHRRLESESPPLASISKITSALIPARGEADFSIRSSEKTPGADTSIPPDVAVCIDCLADIRDPSNRRFGYPFTNCTNCGPRWTIIDRIPYDRPFTSMAPFEMCSTCRSEYEDPRNRRFHAQPNACAECGPRLRLDGADGPPLATAARLLIAGRIVALKGLGGFHLAVRADDEAAVTRLRDRKHRDGKPLALMAADIGAVRTLTTPTTEELATMSAPAAPIVLLVRRTDAPVAPSVAPGHRRLGVMLPSTPLHHLLFDALAPHGVPTLVMTSGNASDEPICLDDAEARARLDGIADAWLGHDRAILRRADDSVAQVLDDGLLFHRRSRGYSPVPISTQSSGPVILAAGAELKNTAGLLKGGCCFISPHVGDLENLTTHDFFRETISSLCTLFEVDPDVIACDRHPSYLSSRWAREEARMRDLPLVEVQHHHAHMVATMAEHRLTEPTVGLILDGTGYGDDGTIWGGEILVGDARGFERAGHLEPIPLSGGDAAVRAPWRTAVSYLKHAFGSDLPELPWLDHRATTPILESLDKGLNAPPTSSCGRLFDAVAALTGQWGDVRYEAQAAIEFMALTTCEAAREAVPFPFDITAHKGRWILGLGELLRSAAWFVVDRGDPAELSSRFHRTVSDLFVDAAEHIAREHGLDVVVLGGGSFQNEILLRLVTEGLTARGMSVFRPSAVSPNDSGLCLGQAVVARANLG